MRKAIAFGIALLSSTAAFAQTEPVTAQPYMVAQASARPQLANSARRATVPRAPGAGVGLTNVPLETTIFGLSPGVAALAGVVLVGGVAAALAADDDDDAPQGTGTGTGSGSGTGTGTGP